jgi:hypothetical protein
MLTYGHSTFSLLPTASKTWQVGSYTLLLERRLSKVWLNFWRESPVKIFLYKLTGNLKYSSSKDEADADEVAVSCEEERQPIVCGESVYI